MLTYDTTNKKIFSLYNKRGFVMDPLLRTNQKYDVILANINRNILLADIPNYVKCLNSNGQLFLSGFYKEDIPYINEICTENGLVLEKNIEKNNWVAVKYVF